MDGTPKRKETDGTILTTNPNSRTFMKHTWTEINRIWARMLKKGKIPAKGFRMRPVPSNGEHKSVLWADYLTEQEKFQIGWTIENWNVQTDKGGFNEFGFSSTEVSEATKDTTHWQRMDGTFVGSSSGKRVLTILR